MCNYCNSSTCGCGSFWNSGCGSFWNSGYQRICRDSCGNIRVANNGCGCQSNCGCQNNCGCGCQNGTQGNTSGNSGNGGFTCVTFCGNAAATASTNGYGCGASSSSTSGYDWYYARQYGLLGISGCPCGNGYTYDTVTQTTT